MSPQHSKCLNCMIFKNKKDQLLNNCDSIFDIALELEDFLSECKEKCEIL